MAFRKCRKTMDLVPNFERLYMNLPQNIRNLFDELNKRAMEKFSNIPNFNWGYFNKEKVATSTLCIDYEKGGKHFCFFDLQKSKIKVRLQAVNDRSRQKRENYFIYDVGEIDLILGKLDNYLRKHYSDIIPNLQKHLNKELF